MLRIDEVPTATLRHGLVLLDELKHATVLQVFRAGDGDLLLDRAQIEAELKRRADAAQTKT